MDTIEFLTEELEEKSNFNSTRTDMAKKTHNIGKYCIGGTIIVEWNDLNLNIRVTEYKKPKDVLYNQNFHFVDKHKALMFLEEVTSPYYAEKVLESVYN